MPIKLGDALLPLGLFLAPMAGYTDRAMRRICREMGAEYLTSEMVSAKALTFGDKKSLRLSRIEEDELPCAIQLFGSECDIMAEGARILSSGAPGGALPTAIDLNFGCPVRKIAGNGEGSALMRSPQRIEAIVRAVVLATPLPVTVKIRAGWSESERNAVECARAAEAGGASMICVHGRTRMQFYGGKADLQIIRDVKQAVSLPVVGNGDIQSLSDAKRMLEVTGCDGLMIGRGAVGNPFLFRELSDTLAGKPYTPPTVHELMAVAFRQLDYAIEDKGEVVAVLESRKQIAAYISGVRGAAALRGAINSASSADELRALVTSFFAEHTEE